MSYILEALADSEQARRQIAVLPRYSLLPAVGEAQSRLRHWPYVLAAALLLNAAVVPLWLRSNSHDGVTLLNVPAMPQAAPVPMAAPAPDKASTAGGDTQLPKSAPATDNAPTAEGNDNAVNTTFRGLPQARQPQPYAAYDRPVARPPRPAEASPRKAAVNQASAAMPTPLPKVLPKVVPKTTATRTAAAASATPVPAVPPVSVVPPVPRAQTVPMTQAAPAVATGAAGGLPPDLQREIPPLSVAGFIRDDTSSGMVIVNDRLLREGDEVAPGLRLEKILHDSLLFNYKGYRFKR
ncbi:MAG: general secretion pathway protein GspB [Burkholderiales bacterium]|nr:general secretion pathway protein GspB [Burkholderiales bacterium]